MQRLILAIVVMLVALTACGGGGDSSEAGDPEASTTAAAADPEVTTSDTAPAAGDEEPGNEAADDSDSDSVSGIGEATLTINGETYFFGETSFPALRCDPNMFGVFFVVLPMVDEQGNAVPSGGGLELVLLQEGTDPEELDQRNEVRLDLDSLDQEWIADEEDIAERDLEPGTSQVDSYTIDGNRASGTATFYEENSYWASVGDPANEVATAQGTFEVTCAGG